MDFLIKVQFAHGQEGLSESSNLISPKIMPQATCFLRPLLLNFCQTLHTPPRGYTGGAGLFIPRSFLATGKHCYEIKRQWGCPATTLVSRQPEEQDRSTLPVLWGLGGESGGGAIYGE